MGKRKTNTVRYSVGFPNGVANQLEGLVKSEEFSSVADVIAYATRHYIEDRQHEPYKPKK